MRKSWMFLVVVTLCALALTVSRVAASPEQSAQPTTESYVWHGELVALDASARTLTVKSRVAGDQAPGEFARFKPGERIMLTWSGYDKYADAISRVLRYDATKKLGERFTFPVEFVSFEAARQYVTFKAQIPADSVASLKALRPGEWVTATSRHRPSSEAEAIMAVNPYVTSFPRTTN